jgi:hypothetical protein
MRGTFRTILVGVLVFSLFVDLATACRFCARNWCYSPCVSACYDPCYSTCCDPCCCGPCYMTCDGLVCEEPCCSGEVIQSAPQPISPPEAPQAAPKPSGKPTQTPATVNKPPKPELPPAAEPEPMPGPNGAAVPAGQSDQWRAANEPPQLPPEPSNSLLGTQPETPAAPSDSLFGEAPEAKSTPAATEPAPALPATTPTEPAPAVTPPAEESNSLFGPPSSTQPSAPAETGNDLFKPSPNEPSAPASEGTSDRYETPEQPKADETAPADQAAPPTEEQPKESDDLFGGFGTILREPGGLASDATRTWVDNTGQYSCQARMIQFKDGHVRLLKDSGRTATVPVYRLSQGDLEFVQRQASAQRADAFGRTAAVDNSQPQPVN